MSDPTRFTDHRIDPQPLRDEEIRAQRLNELESSNAMWGWVAGAVVLALVLMFVFTRGQVHDVTANNVPSPPAIGSTATPQVTAPPIAQRPAPEPTTTGSGTNQ